MIEENTQSVLTFGLHTHTGNYIHMPRKKKKVETGWAKQTAAVLWRPVSALRNLGFTLCALSTDMCGLVDRSVRRDCKIVSGNLPAMALCLCFSMPGRVGFLVCLFLVPRALYTPSKYFNSELYSQL